MSVDYTKVTVLGGGKKKIVTRNRSGSPTERYDVRWRIQLRSGANRMFRQRFDRAADADNFVRRLNAVGLPGSSWILDANGRPHDGPVSTTGTCDAMTVWDGLLVYRAATWRTASANGRKNAAPSLRAMGALLRPGAPSMPGAAKAYLDLIAFRRDREPDGASALSDKELAHRGRLYSPSDLLDGRRFLKTWSLFLDQLDRSRIRDLIGKLGTGRAASTEGRRWTQVRAVLRWWHEEELITADLTSRARGIRGTSVPSLGDDEPIPDESEMWMMAWALCLSGRPEYASLPLVMGGAGLRIGECCELRRRDCVADIASGGMWLAVRGTLSRPGRSWTDSGEARERRGTKANGPDGDLRGRRTFLPALSQSTQLTSSGLRSSCRWVGQLGRVPRNSFNCGGVVPISSRRV